MKYFIFISIVFVSLFAQANLGLEITKGSKMSLLHDIVIKNDGKNPNSTQVEYEGYLVTINEVNYYCSLWKDVPHFISHRITAGDFTVDTYSIYPAYESVDIVRSSPKHLKISVICKEKDSGNTVYPTKELLEGSLPFAVEVLTEEEFSIN